MRGGWRYGAGRPGWRRKAEHCLRLDVRNMARWGQLRPGARTYQRWTRGGEPSGNIVTVAGVMHPPVTPGAQADHVQLIYNADGERFDYAAWLDRTGCSYGGTQVWWRCPRCGRRCAVIYGVASDGRFGCRRCMNLSYASEAEGALDRASRALQKAQARIGDTDEAPRYVKPKGMHWRTFNAMCERIEALQARKDDAWLMGARALLDRIGWPPPDLRGPPVKR